jgi:hypothetical protein
VVHTVPTLLRSLERVKFWRDRSAFIALPAARRTALPPWKRFGPAVAMAGLGAAVLTVETLAH